jgi:hypothetical protein
MKNKLFFFVLIFFAAFFSFSGRALAAVKAWQGNASSNLASDVASWEGGVLPSSGDDLTLPPGATVNWDLTGIFPRNVTSQADVSLKTPFMITGDLNVGGGTFSGNSNAISVGGSVILSGGQSSFGGSSINVGGDWKFSGGNADLAAATISFTGGNDKTIYSSGNAFGNLSLNAPGATVKLADDFKSGGTVTVGGGTFSLAGKTMNLGGGLDLSGGAISLSGGKIVFAGTTGKPFLITGGSFDADGGGAVVYAPVSGGMTVAAADYFDLELSGNAVFSLSGATTVKDELTIDSGATLSPGTFNVSVPGGGIKNNGKILSNTGVSVPVGPLKVTDANLSEISSLSANSGTIRVSVEDQSENLRGDAAESIPGLTLTTLSGDKEIASAAETGVATGVFATVPIVFHEGAAVQENGQLEVSQNDIVFATYADPQNSARTKTVQITVSAAGSVGTGAPQIVAKPVLVNWSSVGSAAGTTYSAHVIWTTDVLSSSAVAVTGGDLSAPIDTGSLTPTTAHDVLVTGLARGNLYSYKISSMTATGKSVASDAYDFAVIVPGDRIKTADSSAVYWYLNGKRNVFPTFLVYDSWFADFNNVVTIPAGQMSDIQLGLSVPMRAGTYLLKIQSDPRVYAVLPLGKLSWIQTESQAIGLYGANWAKRVADMDVAFFSAYSYGDPLSPGKIPDGFVYSSGNEPGIFLENSLHPLANDAFSVNGVDRRFVSSVSPTLLVGLASGGVYSGYAPAADAVFADGGVSVVAPARIEQ